MSRRAYDAVVNRARKDARAILLAYLHRNLPKGWTLSFMVGWGLMVDDEKGEIVMGLNGTDRDRLTKRQERALEMAADFADTFGMDNSQVVIQ